MSVAHFIFSLLYLKSIIIPFTFFSWIKVVAKTYQVK